MNILFITATYLGDAILSTGILADLLRRYPHAHLTVVSGPVPAPLFKNIPQVHVIPLHKKKASRHWLDVWARTFRHKWDIIVDLRGTALSYFMYAKKRYVFRGGPSHQLKSRQLADLMGLVTVPWNHLWITDAQHKEAACFLPAGSDYIALSPTANWPPKCWPLAYYIELAQALLSSNQFTHPKIVLVGAANQEHDVQELIDALPSQQCVNLMGKPSLPTLAACLERCRLFVGNDSGLMHMAATIGIPTLGLFGPSPSTVYAPWGPKATFVKTPGDYATTFKEAVAGADVMRRLSVAQVMEEIWRFKS